VPCLDVHSAMMTKPYERSFDGQAEAKIVIPVPGAFYLAKTAGGANFDHELDNMKRLTYAGPWICSHTPKLTRMSLST
jgi:hypothetical protein